MIILAVSDDPSPLLEQMVARSPERFGQVGLIVSCGDLDASYVEYLADATRRPLQFISGNHPCESRQAAPPQGEEEPRRLLWNSQFLAGVQNLHGRVQIFGDYILLGFSGCLWYNGEGNQFREEEMEALVRRAIRRLMWIRWREFLSARAHRKAIVITHAPIRGIHDQPDPAHRGFECFRMLLERIEPALWIHGHIHVNDPRERQTTLFDHTTIVNAYGHKFIRLEDDRISVSPHLP